MARNLFASLAASLLLISLPVTTAASQPPTTTTEHGFVTETFIDEVCGGEFASVTSEGHFVVHTTLLDDGRHHIAGSIRADVSWTQSGVTYVGHTTSSFAQNSNKENFNGIIMINGQGNGSDGSRFSLSGVIHTTVNANGEVTVDFDRYSIQCR